MNHIPKKLHLEWMFLCHYNFISKRQERAEQQQVDADVDSKAQCRSLIVIDMSLQLLATEGLKS